MGAIALVLLSALAFCASRASADPLSMTFTESRANVGVQLSDTALFEAPEIAPLEAQIDPGSGAIGAGDLQVPQFSTHITDPLNADVAVDFEIGIIAGSFTQATGALSLSGEAGGTLTAGGKECTVSTTPAVLTLSTAGNNGGTSPRSGAPFAAGLNGAGAIAGQWTDMHATPTIPGEGVAVCNTVDDRIGGPGGILLEQQPTDPLSMTFTESRANVGVQLSDDALFEPPETAPFEARIDPSGSIVGGALQVPQFSTFITDPIDADVAVDFEIGTIGGSFTQATGALTLSGTAGGTLTANGKECTVSTTPAVLTLSTAGNNGGGSPRSGAPFSHGLTGAGAIAGQWTDMHATPVDPEPGGDTAFCEDVEDQIGGPGGVWLDQEGDVVPPSAPQLTSTDPASSGSSGTPRIRGSAEAGSTVRVYAGPGCAGMPIATGSAAALGSPGFTVDVAKGVTAAFSATATDAADNTSACSAPISYTRLKDSDPPPPPPSACIVPQLAGKKLARAKTALKAAHCAVGEVTRPKARKGRRLGQLVVKSSTPSAGEILQADSEVDLRLGPKPRKAHR
jgi:hypothetical protein